MEIDIYSIVENEEIECKEAAGGLPKDLWETYSAFCNTNGGTILLGIKEKKGIFSVCGIENTDNILKDLWDNLNNPKKVSSNILNNSLVKIEEVDNKKIILINVPKAERKERPVYIGENPFNESKHLGTYRRNHSGDYKCSSEEIKRMIADQLDESQDSIILDGFSMEDLNQDTIDSFRNRLRAVKPNHPWVSLEDKSFLYKLGAYDKDRKTGREGITAAGLLMFGEDRSITDEFPKYFLDYREKMSQDVRWDYRVISSDGTWSGNIFDFYFKIINRITDNLNIPFRIVNGVRHEDTRVHEAVREAVANSLIHSDYRLPRGIVIEKGKTFFKISNPGSLRISREEVLRGGISDPRNENIFKMFNILGVGERAGSGLENIQLVWKEQEWLAPDLEELYNPDRIDLTLRTVAMLPEESIRLLKSVLKDKYNKLNREEVMALVAAHQEGYVTNNRLQQLLDTHAINSSKIISSLVDENYLEADGIGRGTKYYLTNLFRNLNQNYEVNIQNNDESDLSKDEQLIVDYIIKNKFITNSLARSDLKLSKTTASRIFNKLISKDKIVRLGSGSQIKYVIADKF
ncbi:hypothetical protein JCM1393_15580 [Clostridium carnis]